MTMMIHKKGKMTLYNFFLIHFYSIACWRLTTKTHNRGLKQIKLRELLTKIIFNDTKPSLVRRQSYYRQKAHHPLLGRLNIQGGPKKRIPSFIFGITSVFQRGF